jgi:glycosyltransferase involved in cell wall biosynthesis
MLPFSDESRRLYGLGYLRARLRVLRYVQSRSFRRADLVIFISEFAKSIIDIVVPQRQGVSAVIPHGIADQFLVPPTSASPLSYPYVAYVSILTVYKAQVEVVRAWALLRQAMPGPEKLLLVGPTYHPYAAEVMRTIAECGLQDQVVVLGDVPYAMLPSLYHGAVANIFASSCENCPNILLEALAAGKPVLCSDYQPMPEFARDAALYFDPYDPPSLTRHLMRVLADPELRQRLGQMSRAQAAQFHWEQSAESTWRALAQLAGLSVEATSCVE